MPAARTSPPRPEEVLVAGVSLAHRDPLVARVLPFTLWLRRDELDWDRLEGAATRRDERQALGLFLELAGRLGGAAWLVETSRRFEDKRRTRLRPFFRELRGRQLRLLSRPASRYDARRWSYLFRLGLDELRPPFARVLGDRGRRS